MLLKMKYLNCINKAHFFIGTSIQIYTMQSTSNQCRVYQCSQCPRDTGYFCFTCQCDLCLQCKEKHLKMGHNAVMFREKLSCIKLSEMCAKHPNKVYKRICEPCQVPVCDVCSEHNIPKFEISLSYFRQTNKHGLRKIRDFYKEKRQKQQKIFKVIRTEYVFYKCALEDINIKGIKRKSSCISINIITKGQRLDNLIAHALSDVTHKNKCRWLHNLQKQSVFNIIAFGQLYDQIYEQSANYPLQNLLFRKKSYISLLSNSPPLQRIKISIQEYFEMKSIIDCLFNIQIKRMKIMGIN